MRRFEVVAWARGARPGDVVLPADRDLVGRVVGRSARGVLVRWRTSREVLLEGARPLRRLDELVHVEQHPFRWGHPSRHWALDGVTAFS